MTEPTPTQQSERRTACNRDCPDACGIVATVEDGRVTRLRGDPDHPITRGALCYRTNQFLHRQYSPDRLLYPLIRTSGAPSDHPVHPQHRRASWDEALALVAERLCTVRDQHGPEAILAYQSGGSLGLLKKLTPFFFRCFGPVTGTHGSICSGAGEWAQEQDFGVCDSSDLHTLLESKHILIFGKNVHVSSPHTIPVLNAAKKRGAQLTLIDPVWHAGTKLCHESYQPRPGGDFALAMAVARLLFERGWTHPDAAQWCDHLAGFEALAKRYTLELWCAGAGVGVEVAENLAGKLRADPGHQAGPTAIVVGWGLQRRRHGAAIVRALDGLGAISGNVGIPGAGVSFYFRRRGAFDSACLAPPAALAAARWGDAEAVPSARTLSEPMLGPALLGTRAPEIKMAFVTCGNPVTMLPDSHAVAAGLRQCETLVVVDGFMTDTATLADVVLPVPTLLEDDDLLGAYGHHMITASRPVVPPPPEVRSDLEIIQGLAACVDRYEGCEPGSAASLSAALAGRAGEWKHRFLAQDTVAAGIDVAMLERGAVRNPAAEKVLFANRRFATASGKAQLLTADGAQAALAELAEVVAERAQAPESAAGRARSDSAGLVLMSSSTAASQSSQWAKTAPSPAAVTIHPDTAAAAGVKAGELAELSSSLGSLSVRVVVDPNLRRDVVLIPKGGHLADGAAANAIIPAEETDYGHGAALYDTLVTVSPAASLAAI